jgi:flavin reductase (DIM6/NTAB) family NADH-FMN oxidoreductase RutF
VKISIDSENPEAVRQAMRQWSTGVTVISSCHDGYQHGMTVSSFTSVSLDPPILLISLQQDSRTHALIKESGIFGVTILADDQQEISERFAGRTPDDEDRFLGLETFRMITGSPFLMGGLAFLDCVVYKSMIMGVHTLYFGKVIAARHVTNGRPLVYHDRHYHFIKGEDL